MSDEVCECLLIGKCTVDQPYAQKIHEDRNMFHRNGRAGYLGDPLMENALQLVEYLANNTITEAGSDLVGSMSDVAEEMAGYVLTNAPKDTHRLSLSAQPEVSDNGVVVYDRPPIMPRLNT